MNLQAIIGPDRHAPPHLIHTGRSHRALGEQPSINRQSERRRQSVKATGDNTAKDRCFRHCLIDMKRLRIPLCSKVNNLVQRQLP